MSVVAAVVVFVLAASALVTAIAVVVIERRHPSAGQFVNVRGARLHVVDLGPRERGAPVVVLIHGASCNLEALREPLATQLASRHRVLLFDRPGHGWSRRENLSDSTPAAQAAMIDEALQQMGITRAIIVGHSWAGAMLPAFALQHPRRVAGLVMLAPVTHPWGTGVAWYHTLAATPVLGPLFAYTLALPAGLAMLTPGARSVPAASDSGRLCERHRAALAGAAT